MHAEQPRTWVSPYYSSFNPLRALAVLLVFSRHYVTLYSTDRTWQFGWVGVDLFFVLSGFLITGILYDSREEANFFRNFYARRALRIFPLYWGLFAILAVIWIPFASQTSKTVWTFAGYVGNLVLPHLDTTAHNPSLILFNSPSYWLRIDHFWSLCVEEQFYLVWPLIIWWLRGRRAVMRACWIGIAITLAIRTALLVFGSESTHESIYYSTYTRCDSLLAGSLLALFIRGNRFTRSEMHRWAHRFVWPSAILLLIGQTATRRWANYESPFMATVGYDLLALMFVGVLMFCIDETSWLSRALKMSRLAALGTVSYGFYIFHELYRPIVGFRLIPWLVDHHLPRSSGVAVTFFFTWGLALVSFHFMEKPILRLKNRFAPASRAITHERETELVA